MPNKDSDCHSLAVVFAGLRVPKERWDDESCCSWKGIKCKKHHHEQTKRVTEIDLMFSTVSGTIARELGDLTDLQVLRTPHTGSLFGFLPLGLEEMQDLEELSVGRSSLSGTLPEDLGDYGLMKKVVLKRTQISGTIGNALLRGSAESLVECACAPACFSPIHPVETLLYGMHYV